MPHHATRTLALLASLTWMGCADGQTVDDPDVTTPTDTDTDTVVSSDPAPSHAKGTKHYDVVFDDDAIRRLDITISPEDHALMQDDMTELYGEFGAGGGGPGGPGGGFADEDPVYVAVTVAYEGDVWNHVGMRYKGNSSLSSAWRMGNGKIPFRLHFDKYEDDFPEIDDQRFWGFQELKFSSGFTDDSLIRDKLASDVIRAAGVPAAKMALVRVHVDTGDGPVFWGVYAMAEDPCGALLDSWFSSDDGNCYKPESDLRSFREEDFENKTHKDDGDYTDIQTLVDVLGSSASGEAWRAELEAVFDVEGFLRYLAIHNLVQNWDAYGQMTHNFYLYGDPDNGGRLTWIPWDFNEAFRTDRGRNGPLSLGMDEVSDSWPLIRRLMDDPTYVAAYEAELATQLSTGFDVDFVTEHARHLHALVTPYAVGDDGELPSHTWLRRDEDFLDAVEGGIVPTVEARAAEAASMLGRD